MDDLAVGSANLVGLKPERELPVVWAVAKGSLRNKLWLSVGMITANALMPQLLIPSLTVAGAYLCTEGVEKVIHAVRHRKQQNSAVDGHGAASQLAVIEPPSEQERISEAIRTDAVLSAEITALALGVVATKSVVWQAAVLSGTGIFMTALVYGGVAAIVKMDDLGLRLATSEKRARALAARLGLQVLLAPRLEAKPATSELHVHPKDLKRRDRVLGSINTTRDVVTEANRRVGLAILRAAPHVLSAVSVIGTAAIFVVGGGIVTHGLEHMFPAAWESAQASLPAMSGWASTVAGTLGPVALGAVVGAIGFAAEPVFERIGRGLQALRASSPYQRMSAAVTRRLDQVRQILAARDRPAPAQTATQDEPEARQPAVQSIPVFAPVPSMSAAQSDHYLHHHLEAGGFCWFPRNNLRHVPKGIECHRPADPVQHVQRVEKRSP